MYNNGGQIECQQWLEVDGGEECTEDVAIYRTGGVGIGVDNFSDTGTKVKLKVRDGIMTDKVKVILCDDPNINNWCDYVFEDNYKLLPLNEVKNYIEKNGHLHNTPSAAEIVENNGIELKATTLNQQEKIEEIFLHLIEMKKEVVSVQKELTLALEANKILKEKAKEKGIIESE